MGKQWYKTQDMNCEHNEKVKFCQLIKIWSSKNSISFIMLKIFAIDFIVTG